MSNASERTFELLTQLVNSKTNLADTLVSKGEEASVTEPFDDLVQKAADYIPKSYVFVDESGNEVTGLLVSQETVFDATVNDVREGKVFGTETGVKTGEKIIPSYNTTEGSIIITANSAFAIKSLKTLDKYDFTKLQAIICPFSQSIDQSVAAEKVSINGNVYEANSSVVVAVVTRNAESKQIDFNIINDTAIPYILRYFTYKEIY